MLVRTLVIASAISMSGLAFNLALAEDNGAATTFHATNSAVGGVSFAEPQSGLGAIARSLQFEFRETAAERASQIAGDMSLAPQSTEGRQRYEVALAADELGGSSVGVGVAQRTTLGVSEDGDIRHAGSGAEVRIGQRLARLADGGEAATWDEPAWYFYVASDDEAITWTPGGGRTGRTWGYQEDRVEIGDSQIGVALQAAGAQASIAYVQRDVQGKFGSAEENFTGVTFTWRR